jgi:YihY family inner membrane protein
LLGCHPLSFRRLAPARRSYAPGKLTAVQEAFDYAKRFYRKAYADNITGLSAMVAYNLLLSILPLALLALFIAGRLLGSADLERSVLDDLRQLFPDTARSTLTDLLNALEQHSTRIGLVALVTGIWFGSSFWGALDTAFCRIYGFECRSWLQQKRFALAMLIVVLAFMAATVVVPTVQSFLVAGKQNLPFGLDEVGGLVYAATLLFGVLALFGVLCLIYRAVPNATVPWQAVWPGAAGATVAITVIDYAFPLYLGNVSSITNFGTTFAFVAIVLIWFYALAIIILGGATINAIRLSAD